MRVYVTVIPEEGDLKGLDPTRESPPGEKLGAVLTFIGVMMRDDIPTRLVITNMKRERAPEFIKASDL